MFEILTFGLNFHIRFSIYNFFYRIHPIEVFINALFNRLNKNEQMTLVYDVKYLPGQYLMVHVKENFTTSIFIKVCRIGCIKWINNVPMEMV